VQHLDLNDAGHSPALVASEFHVGPIDSGDDTATTIDAGNRPVRNYGHPVGKVAAEVISHSPFLTQPQRVLRATCRPVGLPDSTLTITIRTVPKAGLATN
jgi:hypothetical protein